MKRVLFVFALIICFLPFEQVRAGVTTGEEIQSKCKQIVERTPSFSSGFCAGFVDGVIETQSMWEVWEAKGTIVRNPHLSFCLPEGATNDQIVKIFVKYLDDHPEELHEPASLLLVTSLRNVFPCKGQQ
jgi:hypothetical protein